MDFAVFSKEEIDSLYESMIQNMDQKQLQILKDKYGDLEHFRKHFTENAGSEEVQKNFQKVVEWYGDKKAAMNAGMNPPKEEIMKAYQNRMDEICRKLAGKKGTAVSSFEVKSLIGEYDFVAKQLFQMPDVTEMMMEMADGYQTDERLGKAIDEQYGEGAAEYIASAILEFYKKTE